MLTTAATAVTADRAWFLFTLMWNDASTGEKRTRAGMQLYRIEGGKLAETWLTLRSLGSAWPDVARQERWTSKRLGRRPERVIPDP